MVPKAIRAEVSTTIVALQVGLVLVALDVVAIELAVGLPVEVLELVAGGVLLVLGELDALALVGDSGGPERTPSTMARARTLIPVRAREHLGRQGAS